ncbi:MAG: hypothetical protein ACT4R6_07365 [Gemmatimonadaceae bacterium]
MQSDDLDRPLHAFVERLRALPRIDSAAVKHVLARVRHNEGRPAARRRAVLRLFTSARTWWAAAAVVAFVAGYAIRQREPASTAAGGIADLPLLESAVNIVDVPGAPVELASIPSLERGSDGRSVEQRFAIEYSGARRVALVGDFNQWNPRRHSLKRDGASGRWTITVEVPVGLHKYAFIVDDSLWTPDPSAVRSVDRDFGLTSSLVLVQ